MTRAALTAAAVLLLATAPTASHATTPAPFEPPASIRAHALARPVLCACWPWIYAPRGARP